MNNMNPLAYGAIVAIIGMLIVFVGLIILIFCVWLMGRIFQSLSGKKSEEAAPAPVAAPAPAPEVVAPAVQAAADDAELIAVIAAALAAYTDTNKSLVIRKVRRVNGWNETARCEQVYRF